MRRYVLAAIMTFTLTMLALVGLFGSGAGVEPRPIALPRFDLPTEPETPRRWRPVEPEAPAPPPPANTTVHLEPDRLADSGAAVTASAR